MPKPRPRPRYRCRFCGVTFSAWIPVPGEPDGALLLGHIRQSHTGELKPFLDQVHTDDDIMPAILQAYEVVECEIFRPYRCAREHSCQPRQTRPAYAPPLPARRRAPAPSASPPRIDPGWPSAAP